MKSKILFLLFCLYTNLSFAQKRWFKLYTDTTVEISDAKAITAKFVADVRKISPSTIMQVNTILNTSPYLIYYSGDSARTVNLPIWTEVIEPQKQFFYKVAGSEENGKKVFGLFFNGFYLPHELGHALEHTLQKGTESWFNSPYDGEVFANKIGILWWRKQGRQKELAQCYAYAKKMFARLPNPVPVDQSVSEYFGKNYEKASQDPFVYGYMQFSQFISIYEDKTLPGFDVFVKQTIQQHSKK